MFVRLQTVAQSLPATEHDRLVRHPGFAGLAMLERDDGAGTTVTLWHTREDAELASEREPRPPALTGDDVYEVDDDLTGPAAGEAAGAAFVGYFDGPVSPARIAAARRAGRDRIRPLLLRVPALVRSLVLWHPTDSKMAVVHLTTSREGLRDVTTAVTSTPLLPGEDASLLTGPDRVEIHRVLSYRNPTSNAAS